MKTSEEGIQFIRDHEGCKLTAYQDVGGVWTIGVGHIKGVKPGQVITSQQANDFLAGDLAPVETSINNAVKVVLNQNQFDALASFTFNEGTHAFETSTLLKKLNAGEYQAAADQFTRWVYVGDKFIQGLYNRRVDERTLFLS